MLPPPHLLSSYRGSFTNRPSHLNTKASSFSTFQASPDTDFDLYTTHDPKPQIIKSQTTRLQEQKMRLESRISDFERRMNNRGYL